MNYWKYTIPQLGRHNTICYQDLGQDDKHFTFTHRLHSTDWLLEYRQRQTGVATGRIAALPPPDRFTAMYVRHLLSRSRAVLQAAVIYSTHCIRSLSSCAVRS
ncbi:hypothetical protein J6590_102427 [Homalodisca vitripennis]|nr:hypothetical protein J6590_102427 [Homalodisca vitripennis]